MAPDNRDIRFLLARLFALDGRWRDASKILEELASRESTEFSVLFFKTAIETEHLDDAIAILERTGAQDWWRPLYEALRAAKAGTPDRLRTVAPEIRGVALEILREIAPGLFEKK